jgi:hypothetical protein
MINKKTITMKAILARVKRPEEIKTIRAQMKVNSPQAIRYLARLNKGQNRLIKGVHNALLSVRHKVITMEEFEKLITLYPEVEKLTNKGKESKLNSTLLTVQAYDNGSLDFTIILSEGKLLKFKK